MGLKDISTGRSDVFKVPFDKIKIIPGRNIRDDLGDLHMLAMQLFAQGQLEPAIVRFSNEEGVVEIVNGERRYRAALIARKEMKWKTDYLECKAEKPGVTDDDRVIEMLQANEGKPTEPMERAKAYQRLIDHDWTSTMIAAKMGCSKQAVEGFLALAKAPESIKDAVAKGKMSATAGKKAAKAKPEKQKEIIEKAEKGEKVKVKDTETHRTQYSLKEVIALVEQAQAGCCHECAIRKDLLKALEV